MTRAVFFDAAGTLFEPREPIARSYARIARNFGLDASEEQIAANFHHAFGSAPALGFGPGHPPSELRRLERAWWRERVAETFADLGHFRDFDACFEALFGYFAEPEHWVGAVEAEPMLIRLKDSGLKLGVISNFDYRLYRILDGLNLKRHFDSITISSEAGYAKPRRELFEAALSRLEVAAEDALHVGDSEHLDFEGARAAGLASVLIHSEKAPERPPEKAPGRPPSALEVAGRNARISSLAQVLQVAQVFGFA
jgi:putative hydrolase of the HAD superfamily